jgi:GT2 family glycosyltransferase
MNFLSNTTLAKADHSDETASGAVACSIVIVCFHSLHELGPCLDMLRAGPPGAGVEVIVVNNAQSDGAEVARHCAAQGVKCLQSAVNLGYGPACNLGAAHAQGRYVLFMNPDVRLSPASLQLLIDQCDEHQELVAIAPLQGDARGRVRGKRRAVGQAWTPSTRTLHRLSSAGTLKPTGFLGGGVLMVRKDAFDQVGGFDENIFLFHEDDDLCLRLAKRGRMAYAAGVLAVHHSGRSSPRSEALTKTKAWHLGNSKAYVARKHYGTLAALVPLLEGVAKFANPAILTRRGRIKASAFLAGAWAGQFGGKTSFGGAV